MLCVDRNVPVFAKTEDGNGSDKVINNQVLSNISRYMARNGIEPGAFIYIADSAMVTTKNLSAIGDEIFFISRLPATYKACSEAITTAVGADQWQYLGELAITPSTQKSSAARYRACETEVVIKDKAYRGVVTHSSSHDKRRQKRIDRQLAQERKAFEKRCKEEAKKLFYCEADACVAKQALEDLDGQYYQVEVEIEQRPKYQRGKPPNGARKISEMRYGLRCKLIENKQALSRLREEAGCFVLITNLPAHGSNGYDSRAILRAYKDQYGIEQNFGFLKDPTIVNSVFLKKPQRIEVLGLVLLISLLI